MRFTWRSVATSMCSRELQAIARVEHGDRQELNRFLLSWAPGADEIDMEPLRVAHWSSRIMS